MIVNRAGCSWLGARRPREPAALLQVRHELPGQPVTFVSQGSRCDQDGGLLASDVNPSDPAVEAMEEPAEPESWWRRCIGMLELLEAEPEAAAVLGFIRANSQAGGRAFLITPSRGAGGGPRLRPPSRYPRQALPPAHALSLAGAVRERFRCRPGLRHDQVKLNLSSLHLLPADCWRRNSEESQTVTITVAMTQCDGQP